MSKSIDLSWIKAGPDGVLIQDQPCWIEVPEASTGDPFLKAAIVRVQGQMIVYVTEHGNQAEIKSQFVHQRSNIQEGFHDMINMEILNDAELLHNLLQRTQKNVIYTYVGPTLLAVNPFQYFAVLYTAQVRDEYIKKIVHTTPSAYKELTPHIYSIAAEAYRSLTHGPKNQTIVISGESGAGKTENAKFCMNLLTSIGESGLTASQHAREGAIEEKILKCNPILEAFGNAKTLRNNNSSRFGKYVKIVVEGGRIQGSLITNYLLEKSRITSPGPQERNFHIFYHLLAGSSHEELQRLYLSDGRRKRNMEEFRFLDVSGCFSVPGLDDVQLYTDVVQAFNALNFQEYQGTVFALVAAILHMSNIDFDDTHQGNNTPCAITDMRCATVVSQLLGVDVQQFTRITTTKTRQVGQDVIDSPFNRLECVNGISAFAREIYEKLFNWLVVKLNETIAPKQQSQQQGLQSQQSQQSQSRYVGLLDIYGFEVFPLNTFEQMFINYTNEKLLQLYILYVFEEEQRSYILEGLEAYVASITFTDNKDIIALLERPGQGIFCVLDDSSAVAGTDETFLNKIKSYHQANPLFIAPRIAQKPVFSIRHTAKDVEYNVLGFRVKNKDEINKEIILQLSRSRNKLIAEIFSRVVETKASDKYLSGKIRNEMSTLMTELGRCDVHFVRCVKPNENKTYGEFDQQIVLNQVRYLGVLETLKVRKESYPVRRPYEQFYKQYGEMTNNRSYPTLVEEHADFMLLVTELFEDYFKFDDSLVLFGLTKVFMRLPALEIIQQQYDVRVALKNKMATKIQRTWRRYQKLLMFRQFLAKVAKMQLHIRGFLCRIRFLKVVRATLSLQRLWNVYLQNKYLKRTKEATKVIQTYLKRVYAIKYIIVKQNAVIRIQQIVREVLTLRRLRNQAHIKQIVYSLIGRAWLSIQHRAATTIQSQWRGWLCRARHAEEVQHIKLVVYVRRATSAVLRLQSYYRGHMVRTRMQRLLRAVCYIQGWFRTRWLSDLFCRIRVAAIIIQRRVRAHFVRARMEAVQLEACLKPQVKNFTAYKLLEEENFVALTRVPPSAKISLFNAVLDMEILVQQSHNILQSDMSDIYDILWSTSFNKFQKEASEKLNYIQGMQVGETHTYAYTVTGRVYSWGLNDHGQLGSGTPLDPPNTSKHHQVPLQHTKQMQAGSYHGLFLTTEGTVYALGSNRKGHCGVGHYKDVLTPQQVVVPLTKQILVVHEQSMALTEEGLIYMWPQLKSNISNRPQEFKQWTNIIRVNNYLVFDFLIDNQNTKLVVHAIAAGIKFLLILSSIGHVYSYGDNQHGELGLGQGGEASSEPLLIEALTEKVVEISAGLKHAVARTSLGKVYVWGWGQKGQLGTGTFRNEHTPVQVRLPRKCSHLCAARTSTLCLMEDKRIAWWGTNGQLHYQHQPCELLTTDSTPILLQAQYSRTMSLITVVYANDKKNKKITQTLTQKWADISPQSLDPPYCELLINHLTQGHMKRPQSKIQIKFTSKLEHQQIMKDIQQSNNPILVESEQRVQQSYQENTEPLPYHTFRLDHHANQIGDAQKSLQLHNQLFNKKQQEPQQELFEQDSLNSSQVSKQDMARDKQLQQVKEKYNKIMMKPADQRTSVDIKFLKIIQESELNQVLHKL